MANLSRIEISYLGYLGYLDIVDFTRCLSPTQAISYCLTYWLQKMLEQKWRGQKMIHSLSYYHKVKIFFSYNWQFKREKQTSNELN